MAASAAPWRLCALARLGRVDPEALVRQLARSEPIDLLLPTWDEERGESDEMSPLRFFRDEDWKINFVGPAEAFSP